MCYFLLFRYLICSFRCLTFFLKALKERLNRGIALDLDDCEFSVPSPVLLGIGQILTMCARRCTSVPLSSNSSSPTCHSRFSLRPTSGPIVRYTYASKDKKLWQILRAYNQAYSQMLNLWNILSQVPLLVKESMTDEEREVAVEKQVAIGIIYF